MSAAPRAPLEALRGKHLRVGDVEWPPYFQRNADNSSWEGFDVDLLDLVAQRLNFTYELHVVERGGGTGATCA